MHRSLSLFLLYSQENFEHQDLKEKAELYYLCDIELLTSDLLPQIPCRLFRCRSKLRHTTDWGPGGALGMWPKNIRKNREKCLGHLQKEKESSCQHTLTTKRERERERERERGEKKINRKNISAI